MAKENPHRACPGGLRVWKLPAAATPNGHRHGAGGGSPKRRCPARGSRRSSGHACTDISRRTKETPVQQEETNHGGEQQRQRRRLRFSLRRMFSFTLWVALICGWGALGIQWGRFQFLSRSEDGFFRIVLAERERGRGQLLVGEYAIQIPRHRYMLVRTKAGVGAFMLTDDVDVGDGGVRYRWFFSPKIAGSFGASDATRGESVVFERYRQKRTPEGFSVTDAGGQTSIRCGPIELEWSMGDYIYLCDDTPVEIAYTRHAAIAAVRADDPSLIWCSCARPAAGLSRLPETQEENRGHSASSE